MQDIIETILRHKELLNQQISNNQCELRTLHWEDDVDSIQILQSGLVVLERELIKTSFVNCTPHHLTIEGIGEIPPSGILPRVSTDYNHDVEINGVRVRQKFHGAVVGLPDPVEGITFIVSGMVRDAISVLPAHMRRPDVCAPDTGADAIRNDLGGIIAVRGLVQ